jgi:hypothetical protein
MVVLGMNAQKGGRGLNPKPTRSTPAERWLETSYRPLTDRTDRAIIYISLSLTLYISLALSRSLNLTLSRSLSE